MGRNYPALIRRAWMLAWMLAPCLFLAAFYFYPLASIFGVSLVQEGRLNLSGFARIATSSYYVKTLWFTVWQAVVSTLLTLILALPGAYVFTRYRFPGKSALMSLATLPFVLPTVVAAAAFSALVGDSGLVNDALRSLFALERAPIRLERTVYIILMVHVFYNYAIALRIISSYWANQSARIEEAARVLGCKGWRLWWEIRLPLLQPAILAAAALVFVFTFTSFGVILILGGPRFATLEVEIYLQTATFLNLPTAAALSLVQIGVMTGAMAVYTALQRRIAVDLQGERQVGRAPRTLRQKGFVSVALATMALLLFTPLAALVIRSFTLGREGFTTRYYARLLENPRGSILPAAPVEAVGSSVLFALATTALAVLLGTAGAYLLASRSRVARWLDPVFMLPLATSAVTLGLGYTIALDEPPLNLRASPLLIPLAHTLVALPFVVRSVLPALRSIPRSLPEAASTLGASAFRVWRYVELPLTSRGIMVGAIFAFTVSMGEFGASLFVARPGTPTIPIVIYLLLGRPGAANYGQALAMSVLLMLVCAAGFALIERLRKTGIGEF